MSYLPNDTFIANMSDNIKSKNELLDDMKQKLLFPDYFGYNWDALYDCLCDFYWIKEKNIVIKYSKLPLLLDNDMKCFVDIVQAVANNWQKTKSRNISFIFPECTNFQFT